MEEALMLKVEGLITSPAFITLKAGHGSPASPPP
jgi:hypothetical protein